MFHIINTQTMTSTAVQEIDTITFGIYSEKDILNMSVCAINNPRKSGLGTVYDPRLGTTDSSEECQTCKQDAANCPGHFGHILLHEPVVHPLYTKRVVNFLNCICMKCSKLLISKDQINLTGLNKFKGEKRFNEIVEKLKKVDICCQPTNEVDENGDIIFCGKDHPVVKFNNGDNTFSVVYENTRSKNSKQKTSVVLTVEEIFKIFDNIPDSDVELLGFNPSLVHPRNFIITILPVCPPCDRPFVKADGKTCDDDLTIQYMEIIKANNNLANIENEDDKRKRKEPTEQERTKARASLRFRILTTFNNSQGKAKHTTNNRAIKSIKDRLTGKDGQIRLNVQGKRCDQTGRTVIGPDPTLKMGELGVPEEIASTLSVPVCATNFNIKKLQDMVNSGLIKTIVKKDEKTVIDLKRFRRGTRLMYGDILYRGDEEIKIENTRELVKEGDRIKRNGEFLPKIKPANRDYKIDNGFIVNRPLKNGDFVLLNRQPTLHKASMMAMKVVIKPYKTLRMNLAITKPFNADFDGDEMNIHVPQSLEAQAELKYLSFSQYNMISAQSSKPNMAVVQDSLLGAYKMTKTSKKLTKSQYFNIAMKIPQAPWSKYPKTDDGMMSPKEINDRIQHIRRILKEKGKKIHCFNGKGLISLFLPDDLIYIKNNNKDVNEPEVKIYRGVLYEGVFDKNIIGSSHNALHQVIHKEYGSDAAMHFIDCIQFSTNNYLLVDGFSVGLGDCLMSEDLDNSGISKKEQINDTIKKCYIEAEGIKETTLHKEICEVRINAALNKAKDIGLKIAKDALSESNNFLNTVNSGSKGDFFNIAQITGLLGQQNLKGKRVPLLLNHGKRSLPHYPFDITEPEMEYESRGFIDRGFLMGLNPRQFYFHAMSGREGICDTAMGTATSGYMQRRIIKLTEDMKIQQDSSVRDVSGKIYQIAYGGNGFDPTCTVKVDGKQQICDISRICDKLNMKHELTNKK